MSLGSNIGASAAAEEIMKFIDTLLAQHSSSSAEYYELSKVRDFAEEIKKTADSGWY